MFKIVLFPLILGLSYAIPQNTVVLDARETLVIPLEYAPCILWYLESPSTTEFVAGRVLMRNETGWAEFDGAHTSRNCFGSCLYEEIHPVKPTEYKLMVTHLEPRAIILRYTIGKCVIRESNPPKFFPIVITFGGHEIILTESEVHIVLKFLAVSLITIVASSVIVRILDFR